MARGPLRRGANEPGTKAAAAEMQRRLYGLLGEWSIWEDDRLAGCGALKQIDATHGEVKSMRTDAAFLGRGVGAAMLEHIVMTAKVRGYSRLSLETGTGDAFAAAHRLYVRRGFTPCAPFADYAATEFNRFYTLSLDA